MNEDIISYLKLNYGKESAKTISEKFNITVEKVYRLAKQNGIFTSKKQNKVFDIDRDMEQIIISGGHFGDGNFKASGKGAIYRENHSDKEFEYLEWKFNKLKTLTEGKQIKIKPVKNSKAHEFETYNSKQILEYKNLSLYDALEKLNELGLVLYLLDDGWIRKYVSKNSFCISTQTFNKDIYLKLKEKFEIVFKTEVRFFEGKKKNGNNIYTLVLDDCETIEKILKKYNLNNLDIYKKKFLKENTEKSGV